MFFLYSCWKLLFCIGLFLPILWSAGALARNLLRLPLLPKVHLTLTRLTDLDRQMGKKKKLYVCIYIHRYRYRLGERERGRKLMLWFWCPLKIPPAHGEDLSPLQHP